MAIVPDFLIKRVYKKGSLRQTPDGVCFELKNVIGPGVISGLKSIQINDYIFPQDTIRFFTQGVMNFAKTIDEANPIHFRLGQEGTIFCGSAKCLREGLNKIIIELTNPEVGTVKVTLDDTLKLG